MRILLLMTLICMPLAFAPGCNPSRPDPRENPDFDEEAFNDVDAYDMNPPGGN